MINPDIYKRNLSHSLRELSSAEYQDRVWVRNAGPEQSSFVEAVCQFYENSLVEDNPIAYWKEIGLTASDVSAIRGFADKFSEFLNTIPTNPDDKTVITSEGWEIIRQEALRLLITLGPT